MTNEPKVNIAIPTYNRSDLLRLSLDSALSQDYPDFRVTILDNASTDDTEAVVRSYSDDRITYLKNETNIGQFRNWNRLLEINESPYLMILQDDDIIHASFLTESIKPLESNPAAAFSFTDVSEIDASGDVISDQNQSENFAAGPISGFDYLQRIVAGENLVIHVSSVLMRASALESVGPFDTPHSRTSIDFNLYFRLAAQFDLLFVGENLAQIRRHEGAYHRHAEADTRPLAMLGERMDAAASLLLSRRADDTEFRRWLAERLLHLSLRRSEMTSQLLPDLNLAEDEKRTIAGEEILNLVPHGDPVIVVDDGHFGPEFLPERRVLPFLERDGVYWGPPANDESAVRELERMRSEGAGFVVFLWPAFWWYDYYHGLRAQLRKKYACALSNSRMIAFDLGA